MSFIYQRTVRLADTDAACVVYFTNLLSICHEAYEECLLQEGFAMKNLVSNSSFALPIVYGEIKFFEPIFCGDRLLIELTLKPLSENEFKILYDLKFATSPNLILAKALTRHVCIKKDTRKRMPFPEKIRLWIEKIAILDA